MRDDAPSLRAVAERAATAQAAITAAEARTRELAPQLRADVTALHEGGWSNQEIADLLGLDRSRVGQLRREHAARLAAERAEADTA